MDSTDTTCGKPATSTSAGKGAAAGASLQPIKDSPFSTYINSFSPISPIQTRPGFLSYGSIYFTSQEPVFRSPHIHQTNQDIWRSLERHPRDDTACLRDMKTDRTLFLPSTLQPMPSLHSKFDENQSPEKQPCRSSPIVDVSLAGPSEIGLNASDSPDLCSKQTEKAYQGRCTMITANQTNSDHNGSPNSQNIAPSSSSALNEFMASSLRSSDLTYVQLNQDTILPRALLDDCSYSGGNVVNFHRSIMHKYICDNSTENVENKLKAPCQVEGSHDMSHDEQLKPAFTATGICRALPAGAQNEKSLINQKWTDVAPFESMNNQNLTHEILKTTSSFLYYRKCIGMDISENLKSGELGLNSKFIQRSLLDVHTVEKSTIPTEDLFLYDEEVSQHQHAMRKGLEFVTAENLRKSPGSKKQISNFTSNIFVADSAENLMSTDTLDTSIAELNKTSSSKQYVQSTVKISMSCQKEGASYVSVPRPFVIGLRSNTLGSVGQTTRTDMQLMERDICERDTLFLGVNDRVVQTSKNQLTSTSLTSHDSIALIASKDKVFHSGTNYDNDVVFGGRNLNKELPISSDSYEALLDQYLTPRNMKTLPAENSNSAAMSNQSSSRKKRKGANNEGQKCCSCKRSQCLKLYCDCFAAGMVCTEACECHECFNSPQHEETILEKRKQIETRNPLAFTPKVLLGASDNKESISYTPSSARHKRGCNCRKSLCLKKYCECFQAGVGCSLGCRCEGCKNKFGRKDGSIEGIEIKHEKPKEENLEMESSGNRFDEVEKKEVVKTERGLRLSPLTPSTECSRYTGVDIPAPLLRLPESPSSPIRSIGDIKFDEEESGSLFLYDQGRDYHPAATLSPRWDDFDDLFNLTPLASLSPGSTTGTFDASEAAYAEIPQRKSPQGDAPSMDGGSLQLHCSPVTPPPQLGENKIPPEPDTSNGVYTDPGNGNADVLNAIPLSNGIVKLNSPKQMCISPWNQATDTTPGLRNARQDILKFVPSFPPLTPYRNKEDGTA